jgi:hypothetical protein
MGLVSARFGCKALLSEPIPRVFLALAGRTCAAPGEELQMGGSG